MSSEEKLRWMIASIQHRTARGSSPRFVREYVGKLQRDTPVVGLHGVVRPVRVAIDQRY